MFLFGERREFLENLFKPAPALSVSMDRKRLGVRDFGVGLIQILQRSNFSPQALYSIQNVGGIHSYSIRFIGGGRWRRVQATS